MSSPLHFSWRNFCANDTERVFELLSPAEVRQHLTLPTPFLPNHAEEIVSKCMTRPLPHLAITVEDELAGCIKANIPPNKSDNEVMIAYWYGVNYHGKGLATAVLQRFLSLLKECHPQLYTAHAFTHTGNMASQRVLLKCGFVHRGEISRFQGEALPFAVLHFTLNF